MSRTSLTGAWSYRALYNDADLEVAFNELRFATAIMTLHEVASGQIEGRIEGKGWGTWTKWELNLTGEVFLGDPVQVRLRGTNVIQDEVWIYDYHGYLLPRWPGAERPRDAMVGSVIRSKSRKLHDAKAGVNASFYAVRRDDG